MKRLLVALALLGLPLAGFAQTTAVPTRISYQGRVTDAAGVPVGNGTPVNRIVTFRIWNSPNAVVAANRLWSEQQTVTIANGEFSVLIGAGTPVAGETNVGTLDAIFNGDTRFLGITIDDPAVNPDPEISPRQQIVANAFSFRAKVAESVASQGVTGTMIAGNAVGNAQVADAAITVAKLATNAVDASKIAAGAVTAAKLGSDVGTWGVNGTKIFRLGSEVGIGTDNPSGWLDIFEGGANPNPRIGFHHTNSGTGYVDGMYVGMTNAAGYMWMHANLHLDFGTNNLNRLRIEADGRFGFNTLNGDAHVSYLLKSRGTANILKILDPAHVQVFGVRANGWVGVGTNSTHEPLAHFHATDNTFAQALFQVNGQGNGAADGLIVGCNAGASYLYDREDRFIDLGNNNLIRQRSEKDGRFGFGMLNGDTKVTFHFRGRYMTSPIGGAAANHHIVARFLNAADAEVAAFRTDGIAFKPGGGSWAASSDRRLKHDIRDLSGSLEKLLRLRSVTFRYNDPEKLGDGLRTGFIAQEMETVFPEWVATREDGMKAISFSGFESVAVQALRELREEKDAGFRARDEKIAALEARIREMETRDSAAAERLAAIERRLASLSVAAARE